MLPGILDFHIPGNKIDRITYHLIISLFYFLISFNFAPFTPKSPNSISFPSSQDTTTISSFQIAPYLHPPPPFSSLNPLVSCHQWGQGTHGINSSGRASNAFPFTKTTTRSSCVPEVGSSNAFPLALLQLLDLIGVVVALSGENRGTGFHYPTTSLC